MAEKPRRLAYGINVLIMILTVLIILGFVNWLGTKHYKRWNLVESTDEALSEQTINVVKNLKQDVEVVYLYTQEYSETGQETLDAYKNLLERYKSLSPHFSYELLDYVKNPVRRDEFLKTLKDVKVYEGEWVVKRGDDVEKLNDTSESALTQAIIKLTTGIARTVCFTEGHGEHDPDVSDVGGYSVASGDLKSENYSVKKINMITDGIPDACSVVVVAGPMIPFKDEERARLTKWIAGGGKAMFLLEPIGPTGLEALFKQYGITAENDILKTDDAASMGVDPYEIISMDYSPDHPITSDLNQYRVLMGDSLSKIPTRMHKVRSLKIEKKPPEGLEVTDLVDTIEYVKAYPPPGAEGKESDKALTEAKSFTVAAAAKKTLEEETPAATDEAAAPEPKENAKSSRIAAYGDSDWAADGFMDLPSNRNLFLNTVAWLSEEEQTIGIRPREKKFIPIHFAGQRDWMMMGLVLMVVPLVLIINAVIVWREKKRM